MTNPCACKAEHWQPHADACPAKVDRPLLTLDNIRSGAVPSDAVAVGYLLGHIEQLQSALKSTEDDPNNVKCVICGITWGMHSAEDQASCSAAL